MSESKKVYRNYRILAKGKVKGGDVIKAGRLVPFAEMKDGQEYFTPVGISKSLGGIYGVDSKLPDLEPGQWIEYS